MEVIWTCPICGDECVDDSASRCNECHRNVHSGHVKDHQCSECRKRKGLDASDVPAVYADELRLRLVEYDF